MSKTVSSSFNKSDSTLSITLYQNGLTKDGEMVGKVSRNTVTLENMIAHIIEENRGLDPFMIQHSAILLQQEILKMLEFGRCVNVLDLGTLYIGIKGSVKGDNPSSSAIPNFTIRFTPSSLANDSLKTLQVDKVVIANANPRINLITNTWSNQENSVSPGKICRITGERLKLGGDSYSLSFIPLNANGTESTTLTTVKVDGSKITKNTGTCLEFYVPEALETTNKYLIRIKTSYLNNSQSRKTCLTVDSNAVTVKK